MVKSINIEEMLGRECSDLARAGEDFRDHEIVLDTNVFRYRLEGSDFKYVVSSGIFRELGRYPEIFPEEAIRDLGILLNPIIITEMVSTDDELLIERAIAKNPKAVYRKNRKIGWVDTQQIGYSMQRARDGKKTVIITDDKDILGAVKVLGEDLDYVKENIAAISVRRYIERKYSDFLSGHEGHFRRALINEIASQYRHAA